MASDTTMAAQTSSSQISDIVALSIKQNHLGASSIKEGRFRDAIVHLTGGLQILKSLARNRVLREELPIDSRATSLLDTYMRWADADSGEREQNRKEEEPRKQASHICSRPIQISSIHTKRLDTLQTRDDILAALLFNQALAHHHWGAHQAGFDKELLLRKALQLYHCSLQMVAEKSCQQSLSGYVLTCLHNIGVVCLELKEPHHHAEEFFHHLTSRLMCLADQGHPSASMFIYCFHNVLHRNLAGTNPVAAAA